MDTSTALLISFQITHKHPRQFIQKVLQQQKIQNRLLYFKHTVINWDLNNDMKEANSAGRLVFAYIPYFRSLSEANLNFEPHFVISYNPDSRILSIRYNNTFPEDFWPENISTVSVLAGKNGAGKSSALYWLIERCLGEFEPGGFKGIIGIYNDNSLHFFHDVKINDASPREINGISVIYHDISSSIPTHIASQIEIRPIYYSGHFHCNMGFGDQDGIWNISDLWLLLNDRDGESEHSGDKDDIQDVLDTYDVRNDLRICKLLLDTRFQETFEVNQKPELKLPRYIVMIAKAWVDGTIGRKILVLQNEGNALNSKNSKKRKYPKSKIRLLRMIKDVNVNPEMKRMDEDEGKSGLTEFLHYALKNFIFEYIIEEPVGERLRDFIIKLYTEDYVKSKSSVKDWIKHAGSRVEDECKEIQDGLNRDYCFHTVRIFKQLRESIEFLGKLQWKDGKAYIDCVTMDTNFIPPLGPQIYADHFPSLANSLLKDISQLDQFCNITFSHSLQGPSSLSSGEQAMLNLFSRIKYALDDQRREKDYNRSIVLFLDEAEIGFHPEWQRQFVNKLTKFVSKISQGISQIQIIYTTHSPITLSDMPKECVNLLNVANYELSSISSDNKKESFGANVFELYGDSFFMENGLIGEFASEKIRSLSEDIESFVASFNQKHVGNRTRCSTDIVKSLRNRIDMIGDERIRRYLLSRLDKNFKETEIERLQKRIKELEEQIENERN